MMTDEQIADIESRQNERPEHQNDINFAYLQARIDIYNFLADRAELQAELEKLDAENHNLKYDNDEVAELQAEVERLKAELESQKQKGAKVE